MKLSLPLDYAAIERILPHRYPFLLVDRITEFEPDKRIVGIKNVTLNERYLAHQPGEAPVLPLGDDFWSSVGRFQLGPRCESTRADRRSRSRSGP